MADAPRILLEHHPKKLKLPSRGDVAGAGVSRGFGQIFSLKPIVVRRYPEWAGVGTVAGFQPILLIGRDLEWFPGSIIEVPIGYRTSKF